jgi:hypothetical protein
LTPISGKIAVLVPRLPPSICGIGDYTSQLLSHLPKTRSVLLLVRDGYLSTKNFYPQFNVEGIPPSGEGLVKLLKLENVSDLIVQYSGYGFDPSGAPLSLLKAIRIWRKDNPYGRLILMAHELWHHPSWWKLDGLRQILHKRELCALAALADQVFTSTDGYAEWLLPYVASHRLRTLPIGSNIIPIRSPEGASRLRGQWILFGRQGSRIVSLKVLGASLSALHRKALFDRLVVIGSSESQKLDLQEASLLCQYLPSHAYERTGTLSNQDISRILLQSEYGVLGQTPSTKSGILMAYASHGVIPVLAHSCRPTNLTYSWIRTEDDVTSSSDYIGTLRDEVLEWYRLNGEWDRIAQAYTDVIFRSLP